VVALADTGSPEHQAVLAYAAATPEVLLVPVTVLPEADYLSATRLGVRVELAMLRSIATGELHLEAWTAADLARTIELVEQYADSDIGLVDASIVAIAERLRIPRILTLDHRHFRMFRPKHCPAFELVP
jgi:uncharacterized protein